MKHCEDCIHDEVCGMWAVDIGMPFVNSVTCAHYKEAADVIVSPCKIGDEIWYELYGEIESAVVYSCSGYLTRRGFVITDANAKNAQGLEVAFGEKSIGKAVFLTREEAEQAVKDMQRGDNDGE